MTSQLKDSAGAPAPWSAMPGWGVVADLTPPELIEMRRLKVLRKVIGAALVVVVALFVGGFVFAMFRESGAEDKLASTRAEGTSLARATGRYSAVTELQQTTQSIDAQVMQLMTTEVDVSGFIGKVRSSAPNTVSITSLNVSLTGQNAAGAPTPSSTPGSTDAAVIGTVTLSGTARRMADLATYIEALQKTRGITNVLPASNTASTGGTASWSVTLSLTDKLHTHKYDVTASTGGTR